MKLRSSQFFLPPFPPTTASTMDVVDGKWIEARLGSGRGARVALANAMGVKPDVVFKENLRYAQYLLLRYFAIIAILYPIPR